VIEYLRLAFATVLIFLPGRLMARSASGMLAWTMAFVFAAWAVVFAVHSNIRLAVLLLAAFFVAALVYRQKVSDTRKVSDTSRTALVLGTVLGWLLWHVAGAVVGDGLFHEGRVRKLVDFGDLHLRTVDEFKDGGLHPGYAFPLWHELDALVAWLSGLDPSVVMRHESSLLAPLALAVAYEAGVAVFGSRRAGWSVALASLAIFVFGPGHGGSWATLSQPGSGARQLLVPAAIALFFRRDLVGLFLVFGALALVHPTYAVFLLLPLLALLPRDWRAYAASVVPMGLAYLWLRPLLGETKTHNPKVGQLHNDLTQYGDQLVVKNDHHFRLAAEVFGRSGAVAVAALVLLPICALAIRERWARFVAGGALIVLVVLEVPWLFVHFSDAASLSQSRRAARFVPFAFLLAGGLALVVCRVWVVPLAFVAGLVLQLCWPGDFDYGLRHGGPALATWIGLFGGLAAFLFALVRRRTPELRHGLGMLATLGFVVPIFVHGLWHWSPASPNDPNALSPRLIHNLRTKVPKGSIVIAPIKTSYEIEAVAPLYVVAAPITHVANTDANQPYHRYAQVRGWVLSGNPAIARKWGATFQIRNGRLARVVAP
jgi:hypothetical protein